MAVTSLELEGRIHALLCGELRPDETAEVLTAVAADEDARRVLREMLAVQRGARTAYGYAGAGAAMKAGLARLLAALPDQEAVPSGRGAAAGDPRARRTRWLPRVAAGLVVAASLAATALSLHYAWGLSRSGLRVQETVWAARVTPRDQGRYRLLWDQVAGGAAERDPWILLSDGIGQFGYLSARARTAADEPLVLVRCLVMTLDGREVKTVNVLLPAGDARVSVPEIASLGGRPLACALVAEPGWATVGLEVGGERDVTAGVRGRVPVGEGPVEIGQFRLPGQRLRVVVQAVALEGGVG